MLNIIDKFVDNLFKDQISLCMLFNIIALDINIKNIFLQIKWNNSTK